MSKLKLIRYSKNPLFTPTKNSWENLIVFNPTAVKVKDKVHVIYRAMGTEDSVSRLGHAVSNDGVNFIRDSVPLYYGNPKHINETLGIEDPRAVNIDGTVYLVYVSVTENKGAYVNPNWVEKITKLPRIALSTTKNFVDFDDYDVILPDFPAKNASLFPKKVNGEYWLLFRKDLTTYFANSPQLDHWPEYHPLFEHRPHKWDSIRTGIGSPPIETEKGWLIFYHGVDKDNIYRLGIIVLDLNDPLKIIYRSEEPLLEPEKDYEKYGFFPNVVFTCGAVEVDGTYFVYYGGADMVVSLATISKQEIMDEIG